MKLGGSLFIFLVPARSICCLCVCCFRLPDIGCTKLGPCQPVQAAVRLFHRYIRGVFLAVFEPQPELRLCVFALGDRPDVFKWPPLCAVISGLRVLLVLRCLAQWPEPGQAGVPHGRGGLPVPHELHVVPVVPAQCSEDGVQCAGRSFCTVRPASSPGRYVGQDDRHQYLSRAAWTGRPV